MKMNKEIKPSDMDVLLSSLLYKIPEYEFTFGNTLKRKLKNIDWDALEKVLYRTINECLVKPWKNDSDENWTPDSIIDLGYGATLRLLYDDDCLYVKLKDGYLDEDRLLGGCAMNPYSVDWDINKIVDIIMKDLKKGPEFYKKEMSLDDYGKRVEKKKKSR